MRGVPRGVAGLAVLVAALGCAQREKEVRPAAPLTPTRHARLFLTAELKGYLGPCGCSENMRGGIDRTAWQVAQARKDGTPVFLVDSGDALFGAAQLPPAAVPQQQRKAKAVAEVLKLMGLSTRAVGPLDDALGEQFRKQLGLPELPAAGVQLLDFGGATLAVVSADELSQLRPRAAAARAQGAKFIVALVRQPLEVVTKAAADGLPVDLVVATRSSDGQAETASKLVRGVTPVAQLQTKGRSLLAVELTLGDQGSRFELLRGPAETERELLALDQRIELLRGQVNEPMLADELKALRKGKLEEVISRRAALAAAPLPAPEGKNVFGVRFIPIEANLPALPAATELVTAYDRDVGLLNLQWAKANAEECAPPGPGKSGYVGNGPCLECHEEAFPVWKATKHASAYETLDKLGKNHHLDCVGCHVTGWQQPGGTCRIDKVEGRAQVGCESCHGPGQTHADDSSEESIRKGNQPEDCKGCHDAENSPHFSFEAYLAKILAPGHGKPLPEGAGAKAKVAPAKPTRKGK